MSCSKEITFEPIVGGLDSRTLRGTGRQQDFELILNMDGSTEEGYSRAMGWGRYNPWPDSFVNQDLHDQMWMSESMVDITPVVQLLEPALTDAVPWKQWTLKVSANRMAISVGKVYVRVSFDSNNGVTVDHWQSEGTILITDRGDYTVTLDMPGNATNIVIIRLIGTIYRDSSGVSAKLIQTALDATTGTGVIIESGDNVCGPFSDYERDEILMLRSVTSSNKKRRMFAATRRALFMNDDKSGNWRVLADGLGDDCFSGTSASDGPHAMKMVTVGDISIFTNGFDPILSFAFNDQPGGYRYWSADYIPDMLALGIQSAKTIAKFSGFVLIGDCVVNSQVQSSRVYWSDFNDPMGWVPGAESAAGYHDFGRGEIIIAMEPLGGYLRIYTSQAIYEVSITTDDQIFAFTEIYRHEDTAALIRYPNSFVNTGDAHLYLGSDSIYTMSQYDRVPQRVEWMHVASGVIFKGVKAVVVEGLEGVSASDPIDKRRCAKPVGGYDSVREAVWFSWPAGESQSNNISLVLWPRYKKASVVDHGFTAFTNHQPDNLISFRDWMASFGVCSPTDSILPKEGVPHSVTVPELEASDCQGTTPGTVGTPALPGTVSYQELVGIPTGPVPVTGGVIAIPKFNSALGTLVKVRLDYTVYVRTNPRFENKRNTQTTYTFGSQGHAHLFDPLSNEVGFLEPIVTITRATGPYDGVPNYAADAPGLASGFVQFPQSTSQTQVIQFDASNVALFPLFTGTVGEHIDFTADLTGEFYIIGDFVAGTDYIQNTTTDVGVNILVTYYYIPPGYTVSGRVWSDADGDGVQDPSEVGIAGIQVKIYYASDIFADPLPILDGMGDPVPGTTPVTTDADGRFTFAGFLPVDIATKPAITIEVTYPLPAANTYKLAGIDPSPGVYRASFNIVDLGTENPKTDVDFGFNCPQPSLNDAINAICGACVDDLCSTCDSDVRFLMASTGPDISIKEFNVQCGIRETLTSRRFEPFPSTSEACYTDDGYVSLLQQRLNQFRTTSDKFVSQVRPNISAEVQSPAATVSIQVGVSDCPDTTDWSTAETRQVCESEVFPAPEADQTWTSSQDNLTYSFTEQGRYVTTRIYTSGTGNCFSISGLTLFIEAVHQ